MPYIGAFFSSGGSGAGTGSLGAGAVGGGMPYIGASGSSRRPSGSGSGRGGMPYFGAGRSFEGQPVAKRPRDTAVRVASVRRLTLGMFCVQNGQAASSATT